VEIGADWTAPEEVVAMRGFVGIAVVVLAVSCAAPGRADVQPLDRPGSQGDQLIFYYDARAGFTSFLTVRKVLPGETNVSIVFYGPTFSTPFTRTISIGEGNVRVIDVGALREDGLPSQQGIAFAHVVDGGEPVTSFALTGNFTVANLATGSAWGGPALAREARNTADDSFPSLGTEIDGSTVAFQTIQPQGLELAGYYNPETLAPVESRGNQVIFVSFEDVPGETFGATVGSTMWNVFATRSDGDVVADSEFTANGVTETDLVSLLGDDANGSAGGVRFTTFGFTPGTSRLIFFAEALGTFGTGYLLPTFPILL
jgi:hypothetical protein